MNNLRLIARLDVKGENLIKGVQLEGLRVVGSPNAFACKYYADGIDELLYMDTVASLYGRNNLADIVARTAENVFIPITVGGGIRSVEDARRLMLAGADKVAVNTAATARPQLISELAETFGSQAIVLSIEARRISGGGWTALTDNGREPTGRDAVDWAVEGCRLGAGEVLVTSVDQEGTTRGFDVDLVAAVATRVDRPVIASGGMGNFEHLRDVALRGHADAVAMAHVLHYGVFDVRTVRRKAIETGLAVRGSAPITNRPGMSGDAA